MKLARIAAAWVLLTLAGCASTLPAPAPSDAAAQRWQGRLLVKVADAPPSSFSSSFELQGTAQHGQLELTSPLGSILARIVWTPQTASLQTHAQPRNFANLDALTLEVVGAELPVAHLFDWLQGKATAAEGWDVDLSAQADGRILAHRKLPQPAVDLRIVLDR